MTDPPAASNSPPDSLYDSRPRDETYARYETLALAVDLFKNRREIPHGKSELESVLEAATSFWDWTVQRPVRFRSFLGVIYKQDDTNPPAGYFKEITGMATAITLMDDEEVTVAVEVDDAKGYSVTDSLTWTSDTPGTVGLQVAADNMSALFVAGAPGNASVTVTDGTLSEIYAVTVTTAGAAVFKSTVGTPTKQSAGSSGSGTSSGTVTTPPPAASGSAGDTSGSGTTTASDGSASGTATDAGGTAAGPGADPSGGITPPAQVG